MSFGYVSEAAIPDMCAKRLFFNMSDCRFWDSQPGHMTFVEINHEIISTAILPLTLIQEGQ